MLYLEINNCKCGGTGEVYTRFSIQKQMYQGDVICKECGETVHGWQWHYNKDHAAEDAVEEWNEVMGDDGDDR